MSESTPRPWRVMKFGGVSVADPARWTTIAELARQRLKSGDRVLIVHSALAGVSNALEALPQAALNGRGDAEATAIKDRHRAFAAEAGLDADQALADLFDTLDRLTAGIALVGEASPRVRAELLSLGELMASRLGLACLEAEGLTPHALDARTALTATDPGRDARAYLDNVVADGADPDLSAQLEGASWR